MAKVLCSRLTLKVHIQYRTKVNAIYISATGMMYYWLQLYRMSWYPEKKLSFVVMHAMVLPLRIDTSTSSQISVLKLVLLTWMKPAGINFSAGNTSSHLPLQAWSQSICMVYFKSICEWLKKQHYVNWLWILLLHTCWLVCVCVFQFVRPCKTVNVASGHIVSYR